MFIPQQPPPTISKTTSGRLSLVLLLLALPFLVFTACFMVAKKTRTPSVPLNFRFHDPVSVLWSVTDAASTSLCPPWHLLFYPLWLLTENITPCLSTSSGCRSMPSLLKGEAEVPELASCETITSDRWELADSFPSFLPLRKKWIWVSQRHS